MTDDYIPSGEETSYSKETIRIRCSRCATEVGTEGTIAQAERLLVYLGWRLGDFYTCPACVKAMKRKKK